MHLSTAIYIKTIYNIKKGILDSHEGNVDLNSLYSFNWLNTALTTA